jgi:trehalose/maltose hydrolase-like predicted phosphorylase
MVLTHKFNINLSFTKNIDVSCGTFYRDMEWRSRNGFQLSKRRFIYNANVGAGV